MIIPYQELSDEAIRAVIVDWLSRQAQENALDEEAFESAVLSVIGLLEQGRLVVTWDDESQTINLLNSEDIPTN